MSLFNDLGLESAMDDGTSKYMLDGNDIHNLSAHFLVDDVIFFSFFKLFVYMMLATGFCF